MTDAVDVLYAIKAMRSKLREYDADDSFDASADDVERALLKLADQIQQRASGAISTVTEY